MRLPFRLTTDRHAGRLRGCSGYLEWHASAGYLFYCGRIEGAKGAGTLFDNFIRFKQQHPSELKLVLAGHAVEPIPARPDIEFLGFVSEARKLQLMRDAVAFVHPSPFESFSIVLLEAFLNGTPALVNAESTVLAEHCLEAEAGVPFESYEDFSLALDALLHNPQLRSEWGERPPIRPAKLLAGSNCAETAPCLRGELTIFRGLGRYG